MSTAERKILVSVDLLQRLLIDAKHVSDDERTALLEAMERARKAK